MPIYEYRCRDCGMVSAFLLLSVTEPFTPVCRGCGSSSLNRLLSRVNVRLSEETRLDRLTDPTAWAGVDENDPQSLARMLKRMGQEMGEDFPGEVDQLVEEAMTGQEEGGEGGLEESD
jgi:putative FmdB family regulatory protein